MTTNASTQAVMAEAMFASAATVVSHLLGKTVAAGETTYATSDEPLRLDVGWVVTVADVPAGPLRFFVRFDSDTLTQMVGIMMGGGATADVGSSMIGEIASQIAATMAEELATRLGHSSNGITAVICDDAKMLSEPPLYSYSSVVEVEGELQIPMAIDFDTIAAASVGLIESSAPEASETVDSEHDSPDTHAANAQSSPEAAPARPTRAQPKVTPQAVAFSQMTPNLEHLKNSGSLDLVHDVPMQVRALLGGAVLPLRDIVSMQSGSVFELDRLSTEPIDLYVNNVLIARGEVVVVDERFAVKISELNPGSNQSR